MKRDLFLTTPAFLLLLLGLFFPFPFKQAPLPVRALFDSAHMLLFFGVTVLLARHQQVRTPVAAALYALLIAILIEFLQPLTGRSAEFKDFIFDCIGIALAVILLQWRQEDPGKRRAMTAGVSILLATFFVISIIPPTAAYTAFRKNFPVLSDFRQPWYQYLWTSGLSGENALACVHSDPANSFECRTTQEGLNTIQFSPGLMDWGQHTELVLHIENPGEEFELHIRIDDTRPCTDYSCRFNTIVRLLPGENTIRVPFTKDRNHAAPFLLNASSVIRVVLFTRDVPTETRFLLNTVTLS